MFRYVLINNYIKISIFVTPYSNIAVNRYYFRMFLYLHSKFECETNNLIAKFFNGHFKIALGTDV